MKYKFFLVLLLMAGFVRAEGNDAVGPVELAKKTGYQTIADELLKYCEGADKKIAIAGFSYSYGLDTIDGVVVAEKISAELLKAGRVKVIDRKEIEKVLEVIKLPRSGGISPASAKEIGKMLGADWVVAGALTNLPDKQLGIEVRLIGTGSGKIIKTLSVRVKKDWRDIYEKLLKDINNMGKPVDINEKGC